MDPFVGSGVVVAEAQSFCVDSIGIDANPWSLLVSKAKTSKVDFASLKSWAVERLSGLSALEPLIPTPRLERYHAGQALRTLGKLRALVEEAPGAGGRR